MQLKDIDNQVYDMAIGRMRDRSEMEGITPEQAIGYLVCSGTLRANDAVDLNSDSIDVTAEIRHTHRSEIARENAIRIVRVFENNSYTIAQQIKLGANCELL